MSTAFSAVKFIGILRVAVVKKRRKEARHEQSKGCVSYEEIQTSLLKSLVFKRMIME